MCPENALEKYQDELTPYEKSELFSYKEIYTIGSIRRPELHSLADKEGFY